MKDIWDRTVRFEDRTFRRTTAETLFKGTWLKSTILVYRPITGRCEMCKMASISIDPNETVTIEATFDPTIPEEYYSDVIVFADVYGPKMAVGEPGELWVEVEPEKYSIEVKGFEQEWESSLYQGTPGCMGGVPGLEEVKERIRQDLGRRKDERIKTTAERLKIDSEGFKEPNLTSGIKKEENAIELKLGSLKEMQAKSEVELGALGQHKLRIMTQLQEIYEILITIPIEDQEHCPRTKSLLLEEEMLLDELDSIDNRRTLLLRRLDRLQNL